MMRGKTQTTPDREDVVTIAKATKLPGVSLRTRRRWNEIGEPNARRQRPSRLQHERALAERNAVPTAIVVADADQAQALLLLTTPVVASQLAQCRHRVERAFCRSRREERCLFHGRVEHLRVVGTG